MKHILIVDDDIYIGDMLEEALTKEGYRISRAYSGSEAVLALSSYRPDLILLDLMLPGLSGEEVLPKIQDIPVIIVSAKVDLDEKVQLLLKGAADYVTKPFATKELLARIVVALRNTSSTLPSLAYENLRLDPSTRQVTVDQTEVRLTRTEYAILRLLMKNPNRVLTKTLLLDLISEDTPDCTDNSLKIHVSNLRKKLREAGGRDYIETVWGIGYKLVGTSGQTP